MQRKLYFAYSGSRFVLKYEENLVDKKGEINNNNEVTFRFLFLLEARAVSKYIYIYIYKFKSKDI